MDFNDIFEKCLVSEVVTQENFNEQMYLENNQDVKKAVINKQIPNGKHHFTNYGKNESRKQSNLLKINDMRNKKKKAFEKILDKSLPFIEKDNKFNFLSEELREKFSIIDTENVSSNSYDGHVLQLIEENKNGLILDCGAGLGDVYFSNVVNYEIVDYITTDIVGVGEKLPFLDNSFDGVVSIAVLEHVKDPFLCAKEISRVLKPGGKLVCSVPFLQPFHGYPHHYFNMTSEGIKTLFDKYLKIERQLVDPSIYPIFALNWFLNSWANGLPDIEKEKFMNMSIRDICKDPFQQLNQDYVKLLPEEKNFELASGTILIARKE